MKVYIRSATCISPQNTFDDDGLLTPPIEYHENRLRAIEPDYSAYIDPKQIRRMGHIIKMGIAAAIKCLKQADVEMPDAIITGTAYGCMADTITFLSRMIEMKEEMLNPTAFIQSTHNTVTAQIALMLQCHGYNNTFVHQGISFESALIDATMLLKEGEADNILVGGTDEMTDTSYTILTRLGLFKRQQLLNLDLFKTPSKGTIGGEGVAFVLLTDKPSTNNMAELQGTQTFYKPANTIEIEQRITGFLNRHGLQIEDIDLVITGKSGDTKYDKSYHDLSKSIFNNVRLANYKHLCGEYPTSSSFALWLAANIIKKGKVPAVIMERPGENLTPKQILIYNHYFGIYHSLILVRAC
ncbi:beta-ketoacyl synthase chain length factor [Mucilaginibacter sp. AW1-3]